MQDAREEEGVLEEGMANNETDSANASGYVSTPSVSRPASRTTSIRSRKKKRDRCDEVLDVIAESLQSNARVQVTESVGRHVSYGKHIAEELEELPQKMAIYCKKLINEAIYHAQLGNLTPHSTVINEPRHVRNNNTVERITCDTASTLSSLSGQSSSHDVRQYYSQFVPTLEFSNYSYNQ